MSIPEQFKAFRIHGSPHKAGLESLTLADLNEGEVTIRVAWSSVNYKDALAGTGQGKILRQFPLVGGIDVAGHVVESRHPGFREGDAVLTTGSGLSETRDGGYSEYARLDGQWVVPLPANLSLRESMAIGTAGFTAALCLWRMLSVGQRPELGPIVVTGATSPTYHHYAALLTAQLGYPARYEATTPDEALRRFLAEGMPRWKAHELIRMYAHLQDPAHTRPTDAVLRYTGRPPRAFEDFVQTHARRLADPGAGHG